MLEFLVDNMIVVFKEKVYQQMVGIPMGTKDMCILPQYFDHLFNLHILNQNLHLLSRENIIFVGFRAVYVYQILFNEIFMFFIVFLYKTI